MNGMMKLNYYFKVFFTKILTRRNSVIIRPVQSSDLLHIHILNESVLPHVNSIPISDFEEFMRISSFFLVIEQSKEIIGFIIVLGPGQNYDSENYKYFCKHFLSFDYVDRIVIAENVRGKGFGSKLYQHLFQISKEDLISCEVNIKPPNAKSITFHQMHGFKEIDQQYSENGKKYVSLMVRVK